jgi:hypothetical protein
MRNFLYCCPITRLNVQGTVAEGDFEGQKYITQSCLACGGFHLVDPLTGKLPERLRSSARQAYKHDR